MIKWQHIKASLVQREVARRAGGIVQQQVRIRIKYGEMVTSYRNNPSVILCLRHKMPAPLTQGRLGALPRQCDSFIVSSREVLSIPHDAKKTVHRTVFFTFHQVRSTRPMAIFSYSTSMGKLSASPWTMVLAWKLIQSLSA